MLYLCFGLGVFVWGFFCFGFLVGVLGLFVFSFGFVTGLF